MVSSFSHDRRDTQKAGSLRGAPPALTGNELEKSIFERPDDNGLDNAMFSNRTGQFVQRLFVEILAGLIRIWKNPVDVDLPQLVGVKIRGTQQGAQPPSQRL